MQSSARTRGCEAHESARFASAQPLSAKRCVQRAGAFDYLLLSDVHLGSDLVTHVRPWARTSWLTEEAAVDDQLVTLFEYHRRTRPRDRPLCIVMAGDFLDLVGVSLPPPESALRTALTYEEQQYGLGSAADHVVHKVWAIARRHPRVFRALMQLVADGNQLVLVRGNHDIELHWRAAQHAFVEAVAEHADEAQRAEVAERIAIHPWFFVVEGLLYVEHGHQFDAMCSYGDPLLPTCPRDSRRIRQVPFSVMLRNVARPTRGLSTARYEHTNFGAYLGLLFALGFYGSARIAFRFANAAARLVGTWVAHVRGEGCRRRHAMRTRKQRFAEREAIDAERLLALEALYVRPASHSLRFVLRSLYLDRAFGLVSAASFVVGSALLARYRSVFEAALCALPAAVGAAYACVGPDRGIVPTRRMQDGAVRIAELFGARWVVMGHTHEPLVRELEGTSARYVNLGHWGEDDLPEERAAHQTTTCTYLHVRLDSALAHGETAREQCGDYRADLMRWDASEGPSLASLPHEPEGKRTSGREKPLLGGMPHSA